jgi:hypothetical protein
MELLGLQGEFAGSSERNLDGVLDSLGAKRYLHRRLRIDFMLQIASLSSPGGGSGFVQRLF